MRYHQESAGFVTESSNVDAQDLSGFVVYQGGVEDVELNGGAVVPGVFAGGVVRVGVEIGGGAVVPSMVTGRGDLYVDYAVLSGGAYAPSLPGGGNRQRSVSAGGSVDVNIGIDTIHLIRGAVVPGVYMGGSMTFVNSPQLSGGAVVPGVRTSNINFRGGAIVLGVRVAHPGPRGIMRVSSYNARLSQVSRQPSTVVTMDMDECIHECGVSPCGWVGAPCQKTLSNCRYPSAYQPETSRELYCLNSTPVVLDGITRPYLDSSKIHAQQVLTSDSLLVLAKAKLRFFDEPDSDIAVDPYRVDALNRSAPSGTEQVAVGGTYWRRWLQRHRYYKGRRVTVWNGFDMGHPDTLDGYEQEFKGVIDNVTQSGGKITITVKGLTALTDKEIPRKTDGKLFVALNVDGDQLQLSSWSGVDTKIRPYQTKYTTGLVRIDDEIVGYDSVEVDQQTGITTFSGLSRGLYNPYGWSIPVLHELDAGVQEVHSFAGHPMDIMRELLMMSGIDDDEIARTTFDAVKDQFMRGIHFAAVVSKKVKIKDLLHELRRQTNTHIWQDETQRISVRVLAPAYPWVGYRRIDERSNIIFRSSSTDAQAGNRITRQELHYDHMPAADLDDGGFLNAVEVRNFDSEHEYGHGEVREGKPIYSRWIHRIHDGVNVARDISSGIVELFKDGEQKISFSVELKDSLLVVGELIEIESGLLPDQFGNSQYRRFMVTKRDRVSLGKYSYEAVATGLDGRWLFIAPDDFPLKWVDGTPEQQAYGCISDDLGRAPDGGPGYKFRV